MFDYEKNGAQEERAPSVGHKKRHDNVFEPSDYQCFIQVFTDKAGA